MEKISKQVTTKVNAQIKGVFTSQKYLILKFHYN